jgi:hypothetical protein
MGGVAADCVVLQVANVGGDIFAGRYGNEIVAGGRKAELEPVVSGIEAFDAVEVRSGRPSAVVADAVKDHQLARP